LMNVTRTHAIYWDPNATMSSQYTGPIDAFFTNVAEDSGKNTGFYSVITQYADSHKNKIAYASTFVGSTKMTNPFPTGSCANYAAGTSGTMTTACITDADVQSEIDQAITSKGWTTSANDIFFLYTPSLVGEDAGSIGKAYVDFCGYHSAYTGAHNTTIYGYEPYTGPTFEFCGSSAVDPASAITITTHELSEAATDSFYSGGGYSDAKGNEVGDKCVGNFQTDTINGTPYDVQLEWSNAAMNCVRTGGLPAALAGGQLLLGINQGEILRYSDLGRLMTGTRPETDSTVTWGGMVSTLTNQLLALDKGTSSLYLFDKHGQFSQSFAASVVLTSPQSIAVNRHAGAHHGNYYVGQAGGDKAIVEIDPSGAQVARIAAPTVGAGGTNFIALRSDGCTILYTSLSLTIKAYDVCAGSAKTDFADLSGVSGIGTSLRQIRNLPDGGVAVTDGVEVYRLAKTGGTPTVTFAPSAADPVNDFAISGQTLWTSGSSTVHKFQLSSASEVSTFQLADSSAASLYAVGER